MAKDQKHNASPHNILPYIYLHSAIEVQAPPIYFLFLIKLSPGFNLDYSYYEKGSYHNRDTDLLPFFFKE